MKNHKKAGGKLLQTNKKWHHLKRSQREWITNELKEHTVDEVYSKIQEKEIWIPYNEIKKRSQKVKRV